jgi:hypothetical protein
MSVSTKGEGQGQGTHRRDSFGSWSCSGATFFGARFLPSFATSKSTRVSPPCRPAAAGQRRASTENPRDGGTRTLDGLNSITWLHLPLIVPISDAPWRTLPPIAL